MDSSICSLGSRSDDLNQEGGARDAGEVPCDLLCPQFTTWSKSGGICPQGKRF